MSSLYNDINKILSSATQVQGDNHIVEDYESRARFERVKLFEAKRILEKKTPSEEAVARAMVQLAGTQSMTSVERDAKQAMVASSQIYRTDDHLKESWQAMGKLVTIAHESFGCDLQEMLGKYKDSQLELMEMTLDLPWRLNYSEPVEVEVTDYAVPGQEHVYKGLEPEDPTEDEVESDISTMDAPMESKLEKLRKSRESLTESHSKEIITNISNVRFDDSDDAEYIANDVAKGIAQGIARNRYIASSIDKESLIEMIANSLNDMV